MFSSLFRASSRAGLYQRGVVHLTRNVVSLSKTDSSGVSILQLKNEPLNKLSLELMNDLTASIKEAEDRSSCRALILTSTCRLFSAGLDLDQMVSPVEEQLREYWFAYQELCFTLYGTRLATIASIEGHALGAGCGLTLCCDSRVLMSSARIGLNEAEYGMAVPVWMAEILKKTVGDHHAERARSLATIFEADHASLIGLVDLVARNENFSVEAYKEAMKWSSIPGRALNKELYRRDFMTTWNSLEARERDFQAMFTMVTDERRQAILKAYIEHIGGNSSGNNAKAKQIIPEDDGFDEGGDVDDDYVEENRHSQSSMGKDRGGKYSQNKKSSKRNDRHDRRGGNSERQSGYSSSRRSAY